ncbi:MAG: glycosyltransferase family 2 protein [bacterium]
MKDMNTQKHRVNLHSENKLKNTNNKSQVLTEVEYSVVIPVYNSEDTLQELYNRLDDVFKLINGSYEIIFVDDSSVDHSWEVLKGLAKKHHEVKIIQLMRNYGQHNALMCGFNYVSGRHIITLDDDLQNPPEEIPKLINKIDEGLDVVYGIYESKKHNWFRNLGSKLIGLFYRKIYKLDNKTSAFRILNKEIIEYLITYDKNFTFIDGLIPWYSSKIGFVITKHDMRKTGSSGYSFLKLVHLALNMYTNFSILPLRVASILGVIFSSIGFFLGFYFIIKKVIGGVGVSGFTSLIVSVTIFSGVQLLTLGILGEYIGRIALNINKLPQFKIRNSEGFLNNLESNFNY